MLRVPLGEDSALTPEHLEELLPGGASEPARASLHADEH
jgi:hypothetical protein